MSSLLGDVVEIVGRFTGASNATFLGRTTDGTLVVYKPMAGEQPLWDFPLGSLTEREVLTYEVDLALGFGLVPETVTGDGPLGHGAVQRFVESDPSFDPVDLIRRRDPSLWPVAVLDLVTNNADRKVGHILSAGERLVAVDHGLTFHPEDKLRTVLWAFAGRPLPDDAVSALARFGDVMDAGLGADVTRRLGVEAAAALFGRVRRLLDAPVHPEPPSDRPAVPWPPY